MAGRVCSAQGVRVERMADVDVDFAPAYPVVISPVSLRHPLRIATSPAERVTDRQPRFSIARTPKGSSIRRIIAHCVDRALGTSTRDRRSSASRAHRTAFTGGGD